MRHLGSVLLAVLAAPLVFVLTGRGLGGLAEVSAAAAEAEQTDYFAITASASATGLAGLLFALLALARFSPLGPALAGLGFLAVGVWALVDPAGLEAAVPSRGIDLVGLGDQRLAAATAVAPLLAVPLLLTLFLPHRWRDRRPAPAAEVPAYPYADAPPMPPPPMPPPMPPPRDAPADPWTGPPTEVLPSDEPTEAHPRHSRRAAPDRRHG